MNWEMARRMKEDEEDVLKHLYTMVWTRTFRKTATKFHGEYMFRTAQQLFRVN